MTVTVTDTVVDDTGDDPVIDPEFQALLDRLTPFLLDIAMSTAQSAIDNTPVPVLRPGRVEGASAADRTATVLLDGDETATTVQVLCELPYVGARVMVDFRPKGAVFLVGYVTACGVPPGSLQAFAGPITTATGSPSTTGANGEPPPGWLWCFGQAVSRSTYAVLFSVIGTTYGSGDGATTFNVPDYRGRIFLGLDNMGGSDAGRVTMANTLGGTGGAETHTISQSNLPNYSLSVSGGTVTGSMSGTTGNPSANHTHDMNDVYNQGGLYGVTNGGGAGNAINNVTTRSTAGMSADHTHSFSGSISGGSLSGATASTGGSGTSVNHLPPYNLCHVIIKS